LCAEASGGPGPSRYHSGAEAPRGLKLGLLKDATPAYLRHLIESCKAVNPFWEQTHDNQDPLSVGIRDLADRIDGRRSTSSNEPISGERPSRDRQVYACASDAPGRDHAGL